MATEAELFINRLQALPDRPGIDLEPVLNPSISEESELRRLFATDRGNARLSNPYVGLLDVFSLPGAARKTRARVVKDAQDLVARHVFPLPDEKRRKDGDFCMSENLQEFQKNWTIFTEGALSQLANWDNVVAAGGSVLACLLPISAKDKATKRTLRKYFHSSAFPTSDVDLFLWGLTPEQAEMKMNYIYESVRDSVPWDVTCVRTKHAVSIHCQYPYRSIQIVLRLYHSPAEILAGFDVDSACFAYDGTRVLASPRALTSLIRQANTVDMSRRSPSYEIRLAKYAARGFEVYVPDLRRDEIDPTIFERAINRIDGLARLLVLERLSSSEARLNYLQSRKNLRSRPITAFRYRNRNRRHKGDLKSDDDLSGLELSNYDTSLTHVPYGPGWNARRIEKLIYQTDLGMNSTFNPKNKGRRLHRHAAFFGTMEECLQDLCDYCPDPRDDEERMQEESDSKHYIKGRVSFLEEDPGRQSMTGSFNPIDVGEWGALAYLGKTEQFFQAIAAGNQIAIKTLLSPNEKGEPGVDVNRRDHVGRTSLHLAIFCRATDIAIDLIDAGVRITARLVDGRSALHLAAQMDLPDVIEKLFERSADNERKMKEEEEAKAAAEAAKKEENADTDENDSSEDDWSSDDGKTNNAAPKEQEEPRSDIAAIPDDNPEQPDILDVNMTDWDLKFTPLSYAIVFGGARSIQLILNAGADAKSAKAIGSNYYGSSSLVCHPLTLAILADDSRTDEVVEQLLRVGASSSQADDQLYSIFHAMVNSGKLKLVEKILLADPSAKSAINVPAFYSNQGATFPIIPAIREERYGLVALLIAHGAKVSFSPDDLDKAKNLIITQRNTYNYNPPGSDTNVIDYLRGVYLPAEVAIARHTHLYKFLISLGAQIDVPTKVAHASGKYDPSSCQSLVEAITAQIKVIKDNLEVKKAKTSEFAFSEHPKTWQESRRTIMGLVNILRLKAEETAVVPICEKTNKTQVEGDRAIRYYEEAAVYLQTQGAKTWFEIFPEQKKPDPLGQNRPERQPTIVPPGERRQQYQIMGKRAWNTAPVLAHQLDSYDALFEACWIGDNERIKQLCLPSPGKQENVKPPIQITVKSCGFGNGGDDRPSKATNSDGIYTPLAVATLARRWDTVRLILQIAAAQYKPKDEKPESQHAFSTKGINLNDTEDPTSDDEDSDTDESMDVDDDNLAEADFLDLAKLPSAVHTEVSPLLFLSQPVSARLSRDGQREISSGNILSMACREGDLEAYVQITDIAKSVITDADTQADYLLDILQGDCPDLLDEHIRRIGAGVIIKKQKDDLTGDTDDKGTSKYYLGLTVHGKKRKDLARRGDAFAPNEQESDSVPLLWLAVQYNALKIVEYLSGPRPLIAYRYHAAAGSGDVAKYLQKVLPEVEKLLPEWIGYGPDARQQTALMAAILGLPRKDVLPMAKRLLEVNPKMRSAYLHPPTRYYSLTPFLLAVYQGLPNEFFDFLLSNGVACDSRSKTGLNALHIACAMGHKDLLNYLLDKLPKDVIARLLLQQTYESGNTPLMIATKHSQSALVEAILHTCKEGKDSMRIRDFKGSLPLHVAVRSGDPDLTRTLISCASPETLHSESGVGETALETARIKWLLDATSRSLYLRVSPVTIPTRSQHIQPGPSGALKLASELKELNEVRKSLSDQGKLISNKKLKDAITALSDLLEEKLVDAQSHPEFYNSDDSSKNKWFETFSILSSTVFATPVQRQLVHVSDVQRSVKRSLDTATEISQRTKDAERARNAAMRGEELDGNEEADDDRIEMDRRVGILKWAMIDPRKGDTD